MAEPLHQGLNYITMRDGTTLSASVWYPDSVLWGQGPWPTVVNYSGYSPSNPDNPPPGAMIANLLGYAAVGVNMRGTGCSGGVFDVFNVAQHSDGYDAIETIARQWFVLHHKVGMVGLSYPGISQLYAASTHPPSLAAITPLSVIEDPWREQWPGGVYNGGFTKNWLSERDKEASPGGKSWVADAINGGDKVCEQNQLLRNQNINFKEFGRALEFFPPDANERRLTYLVPDINVPVYLTGAWEDEQTGSRFATMLDDFTNAPIRKFTMFNGRHPDGYTPLVLTRWYEFLQFYVAREIPRINPLIRLLGPAVFESIFGPKNLAFEKDRFGQFTDFNKALTAYEAEPEVRVLFESGYGSDVTQSPISRYETTFESWPPKASASEWYLDSGGKLAAAQPTSDGITAYQHDAAAGSLSFIVHDSLFLQELNWQAASAGFVAAYDSKPLSEDLFIAGNGGYADLWFASDATQANVEVNVIELRPDGTENLVQTGVFGLRHRHSFDPSLSGEFLIEYLYNQEADAPLVRHQFEEVKVPIRPFAYFFRAGSRLRITVNTPGRDNGFWEYENPDYGQPVSHYIGHGPDMPSKIVLPEITSYSMEVPASYPPCGALRGIVCRKTRLLPNSELAAGSLN